MPIQRLTEDTIGKIAAGEVIERPSAVVKELIENAIDAGSTRIEITIVDGGTTEITVRDNGHGIQFGELPLTVERHATSKIQTAQDLDTLRTLGFRGEALASLAAVSRLQIRTLATGEQAGGMLESHLGRIISPEHIAWGGGTAISARDLFENVPARKKFLRQPSTESAWVTRMTGAYALAYPSIAFTLNVDGRRVLVTDGSGNRLNAAVAIWGAGPGASVVELTEQVELHEGYGIEGVISMPDVDRANRQHQHLFVQGRMISDRQLSHAFEQAYSTLLMVGRHPFGCLMITVPPDQIDVNVHPTKSEVRFGQDRVVYSMVLRAARNTLLEHTGVQPIPTVFRSPLASQPYQSDTVQRTMNLASPDRIATRTMPDDDVDLPEMVPATGRVIPVLRVLGQVANSFVIAEGPDGMYLVDQHAAHERIMFERLMAEFESRSPDRQMLLQPVTLQVEPELMEMFRQAAEEFAGFGFDIEEFGQDTLLIRAVPANLKIKDPGGSVATVLDELVSGGRGTTRLESLAISAACHVSIRAGQPLSLIEMRELVVQLEQCSSPRACGHGRPTMIRMSSEELERQFERR